MAYGRVKGHRMLLWPCAGIDKKPTHGLKPEPDLVLRVFSGKLVLSLTDKEILREGNNTKLEILGNFFSIEDLRDLFSLHANVSSCNTMKNAFLTKLATEEGDECVEGRRDRARFGGIGFKRVRQIHDGHC
ncbi:hypothetical protein QJS10_CPB18g01117 [Acorus calamus]|uniref:Uncharacterized protein n=1 Tax=Acorus calamus TaxID=4465 RepID=A0AAV9CLF5_ACOCL|nr:hypothetical protein QJS10_CPB18g01117 [Acorus calamus]